MPRQLSNSARVLVVRKSVLSLSIPSKTLDLASSLQIRSTFRWWTMAGTIVVEHPLVQHEPPASDPAKLSLMQRYTRVCMIAHVRTDVCCPTISSASVIHHRGRDTTEILNV